KELLEARTQLDNLLTFMDGKAGAEDLITKLINDPTLQQALSSAPKTGGTADSPTSPPEKEA
ncbi:MAG: type VI secretion system contractile sheath small subunit, partial [Gemmatimonadales bacterium]